MSVDTAKEVAQDKTLRNKAEKDRRLREKNQNNTKKFIEERKMTAMRQNKESEKLKKQHEQEMQDLSRDIKLVSVNITAVGYNTFESYESVVRRCGAGQRSVMTPLYRVRPLAECGDVRAGSRRVPAAVKVRVLRLSRVKSTAST